MKIWMPLHSLGYFGTDDTTWKIFQYNYTFLKIISKLFGNVFYMNDYLHSRVESVRWNISVIQHGALLCTHEPHEVSLDFGKSFYGQLHDAWSAVVTIWRLEAACSSECVDVVVYDDLWVLNDGLIFGLLVLSDRIYCIVDILFKFCSYFQKSFTYHMMDCFEEFRDISCYFSFKCLLMMLWSIMEGWEMKNSIGSCSSASWFYGS